MVRFLNTLGIYLAKFFAWLIHIQPVFLKNFYGDCIGILWFDILRIRRQLSINNTRIAFPDMSDKERVKMVRTSLRNMGRAFFTYFSFPFIHKENVEQFFVVKNKQYLEQALEKKKGVMLLSIHTGAYDFAAVAVAQIFQPFFIISKSFKLKWLNNLWFALREWKGIQLIAERKSSFAILKALKANGMVIFVIDQFMGKPIGIKTKFFGKDTGSPMGLAVFAMKTRAPIVPVNAYVEVGKNVLEFFPEIPFEEQATKQESIQYMTDRYNFWVEERIRAHPAQWMWVHNRWKIFRD